jgi:hypothetical protein
MDAEQSEMTIETNLLSEFTAENTHCSNVASDEDETISVPEVMNSPEKHNRAPKLR